MSTTTPCYCSPVLSSNLTNIFISDRNWCTEPIIQAKYLAQVYCISPEYALAVYDLLKDKKFDFSEVRARSKDAPKMGKETRFLPSEDDKLVGYPAQGIYNM